MYIGLGGSITCYVIRGTTVSMRLGQIGRRVAKNISGWVETITVYKMGGMRRVTT